MDPITRAIFIVVLVFGCIWASHYLHYHRKKMEMKLNEEKKFSKGLQVELAEIRERLTNLEKIVTDKGYRIKEEIDNL
ncbi:MAG: hypothetical protein WDZ30_01875 [Cellvibrionaceae bacterium]